MGEGVQNYALVPEADSADGAMKTVPEEEILLENSSLDAPELSGDSIVRSNSKEKHLRVGEAHEEFERLKDLSEKDNVEYADIVHNATISEDVPNDCWGALIFIVVIDFPEVRAGRASREHKVRIGFCTIAFLLNLGIQGILLFFIGKLLMLPLMLSVQDIYRVYHEKTYIDGVFDPDQFADMSATEKSDLCGLALSQALFVRVILFLWVTTNVGECRDNLTMMFAACNLPRLPAGVDTRLMVRDLPQTEVKENSIVCLNLIVKISLLIVVFIPKFLIAVVLSISGCVWLMAAENTGDLILNSLALAFVCKVDELVAEVFFPKEFQEDLKNLSFSLPAGPEAGDDDKIMEKRFRNFVWCAVILASAMAFVEVLINFQPVIPSYQGDVGATCMGYINSQVPWCMPWHDNCFPTKSDHPQAQQIPAKSDFPPLVG